MKKDTEPMLNALEKLVMGGSDNLFYNVKKLFRGWGDVQWVENKKSLNLDP